ncbi:MAG: (2Fe-2S)-binding protein [Desulforhopalus sp.]
MNEIITFLVNGEELSLTVDGNRPLLWVLRQDLELTGTKYGCGLGLCGSCTVLLDGKAVRSCQTSIREAHQREITTIEGLATGDTLHPVQQAFVDHDALQCGYCTPGMIMQATSLLQENPQPDRQTIIEKMDDNLCRCGAHNRIIEAIETASTTMKGGK